MCYQFKVTNMKKLLLTLLLLAGISLTISAQNHIIYASIKDIKNTYHKEKTKPTVGSVIGEVASALLAGQNTTKYEGREDEIKAAVTRGMANTLRVRVINGEPSEEIKKSGNLVYVEGTINNISTTQKSTYHESTKRTSVYYMGSISVSLTFTDALSNNVIFSPTFTQSEYDCAWLETAENALVNAKSALSIDIREYLDRCYPLTAHIIEGERATKNKQKEVYIDLGSQDGVYEGLHFTVFSEKMVGNKVAQKKLGKLKVTAVEGTDISLCKVQTGGRDIKDAIEAGANLVVRSID